MKEKKQQPTTSKKSSHNSLDWVEKQLRDVQAFDLGMSIQSLEKSASNNRYNHRRIEKI